MLNMRLRQMSVFVREPPAVVSSIGSIKHGDRVVEYCNGGVGSITREIYDSLVAIQEKKSPDTFGWLLELDI